MTDPRDLVRAFADDLEVADVAFGHGAATARAEAEHLVLGYLDAHGWSPVAPEALRALLARRIRERIPVAHLTGRAWFAERWFVVSPGVMIPRSPLQELILDRFRPWLRKAPDRILDLCCGCGALGIAAALEFPGASLTLADVDPGAVACARTNVARFGLETRAEVGASDLFDGLDGDRYDLVIANPPYVPASEIAQLPPEYGNEPTGGLASGADGLACWRGILGALGAWLEPGGLLAGEVGDTASALAGAFPELPFTWPELVNAPRLANGDFGVFVLDGDGLSTPR
ncbi:MAG: 50S ribosomal protein L3 N(5)-glutamine methyltransferase [Gammaproteobacteria bacterium]|nr:50S ribosomal protein L3 N(5)-glutamine methyltransferase [Gammaproteobacteria bacterium]